MRKRALVWRNRTLVQMHEKPDLKRFDEAFPSYCTFSSSITKLNTLQHTATHCNTLQHTAIHCNTLQHTSITKFQNPELSCRCKYMRLLRCRYMRLLRCRYMRRLSFLSPRVRFQESRISSSRYMRLLSFKIELFEQIYETFDS